jgi:hypothetical protein
MAREYRVHRTSHRTICRRFAKVSYRPVFVRPAVGGCLSGFNLRLGAG